MKQTMEDKPFNNPINRHPKSASPSGSNDVEGSTSSPIKGPVPTSETGTDLGGELESSSSDRGISDSFSLLEAYSGVTSKTKLEEAIERCKEMILEASENSDKRKSLVKLLVHLRLKMQELNEPRGEDEPTEECKVVLGHNLVRRNAGRSQRRYCEKCCGLIWGVLHSWYSCKGCGLCCHARCAKHLNRTCARVRVDENPTYSLVLCPEEGLSAQMYKCAECEETLIYGTQSPEPRQCDYNGLYYCSSCHWNDDAVIPARVLHNWDFERRKVCRASKQFLRLMKKRAVLRIEDINPMLFTYVEELHEVKRLREEILIMKQYFLVCKKAKDLRLLLQLSPRQHFVDSCDMYSLQDLVDVENGSLVEFLRQVHSSFAKHIKDECETCHVKGYICELCKDELVIFSFDFGATVCPNCGTVFHSDCFLKKERKCPRCERLHHKQMTSSLMKLSTEMVPSLSPVPVGELKSSS